MTKPTKVKSLLTTQNMNTATKLTRARTRKPKRLHKHPKTLCSKENRRTLSDQTVPCFNIQIRIINMKHDTRQLISQPEMNNSFRKIILDTYDCKRVMVAETEDLIIEYCMTTEKITNLCSKEGEKESLYSRMRKRHLRDWPDNTLRIKDDGHSKSISEFRKQLLGLKHYTASL